MCGVILDSATVSGDLIFEQTGQDQIKGPKTITTPMINTITTTTTYSINKNKYQQVLSE